MALTSIIGAEVKAARPVTADAMDVPAVYAEALRAAAANMCVAAMKSELYL